MIVMFKYFFNAFGLHDLYDLRREPPKMRNLPSSVLLGREKEVDLGDAEMAEPMTQFSIYILQLLLFPMVLRELESNDRTTQIVLLL